jgi:hypothetical protein
MTIMSFLAGVIVVKLGEPRDQISSFQLHSIAEFNWMYLYT